jgi:hypothetical protein
MPDFALRKWPNPNEEPNGLFKPSLDFDTMLWSPVVELLVWFSEHIPAATYHWFQRGAAVASMQGERLRYTAVNPTKDGSTAFVEYWMFRGGSLRPIEKRHRLVYTLPTAIGGTVEFGNNQEWGFFGYTGTRVRYLTGPGSPVTPLPPCWSPVIPIDIQTRAVDPLDYSIDEVAVSVADCEPS